LLRLLRAILVRAGFLYFFIFSGISGGKRTPTSSKNLFKILEYLLGGRLRAPKLFGPGWRGR
jgi:hypothetical protein